MHSLIENAKKGKELYHPCQYETLLQFASPNKPFHVMAMTQEDFFNYKTIKKNGTFFSNLLTNKLTDT